MKRMTNVKLSDWLNLF